MRSPGEVVADQLDAYNLRDIDLFMEAWHSEAEYYSHPDTLLAKGLQEIRERHVERFREPDLFGRLISRVQIDRQVIDHEIVTRNFPEGKGTVEVICIYEVQEEKITKAWLILGNRQLE